MKAHRLLKQFDSNIRHLKILHDHLNSSVKCEFSFLKVLKSIQQAHTFDQITQINSMFSLNNCNISLRVDCANAVRVSSIFMIEYSSYFVYNVVHKRPAHTSVSRTFFLHHDLLIIIRNHNTTTQ
jgi:hypothetical protein